MMLRACSSVSTAMLLLIPADRLGFFLQRRDQAGEGAGVGAELVGRLVILIGGQRANLVAKRGVAQPG